MTDERLIQLEAQHDELAARITELEEWQAVFYAALAIFRWTVSIMVPVGVVVLAYYLGAR